MASKAELALILSLVDEVSKTAKSIKGDLEDVGKSSTGVQGLLNGLGKTGATVALGGLALVSTAVVGIGTVAFAAGMEIDEAFDTIAISTGKTGDALEGLQGDFEAVFTSIPTEAGPAAETISELNRRLGITGPTLQDVSKNVLEMSRLLGGDAQNNAALFTRVMGDWGVSNEDAAGTLDMVFRASQLTGAGVEGLMQKVVQFGSPLRLMGFTLEDSIALFAKWEKEGVNAELAIGSLRIAAGKFAREGVDLQEGLQATISEIQNMDDASAALALGMEVFGARAGPDMTAAIREGRFAIDELAAALENSEGAILAAADATADFPEKLQVLKNTATTALAPMGIAFMDIVTTLVERLAPALQAAVPIIEMVAGVAVGLVDALLAGIGPAGDWSALWERLTELLGTGVVAVVQEVASGISEVAQAFGWLLQGDVASFLDLIWFGLEKIGTALGLTKEQLRPFLVALWDVTVFVRENLQPILAGLAAALLTVVVPAFVTWAASAGAAAVATITALAPVLLLIAAIGAAVGLLVAAWENDWGGIQEKTRVVVEWIQTTIAAFLAAIQAWWANHGEQIVSTLGGMWDWIRNAFGAGLAWIKQAISDVLEFIRAFWAAHGEQIISTLGGMWDWIRNAFGAGLGWIKQAISDVLEWARAFWAAHGEQIISTVQSLWSGVTGAFQAGKDWVQNAISTLLEALRQWWAKWGDDVMRIVNTFWAGIQLIWKTATDFISGIFEAFRLALAGDWYGFGAKLREVTDQFLQNIWAIFENKLELIKQLVSLVVGNLLDLWAGFKDKAAELVKMAIDGIINLWHSIDWRELGSGVINGIKDGILRGVGAIKDAAREVARRALEAAKGFLGISSPSRIFREEVGMPISEGLAGGILAAAPSAVAAIDNLGAAVVREAQRVLLPISETLFAKAIPTPDELKRLATGGIKKSDASLPYDGFLGIGGVGPGGSVDPDSIGTPAIIPTIGVDPSDWNTGGGLPGETSTSSSRGYSGGGGGGSWSAREKQDLMDLLTRIAEALLHPISVTYNDQRAGASDPNIEQVAADLEWQMRMGAA